MPVVGDCNFAFFDMLLAWGGRQGTGGQGPLFVGKSVSICYSVHASSSKPTQRFCCLNIIRIGGVELKMNDICIKVLMDPLYRLYVTVIYMNT